MKINARTNDEFQLLVIARRYWPFSDDSVFRLMHWTGALKSIRCSSTILTARWVAGWPQDFQFRGARVQRLLPAPSTHWNESHFQKNLIQWLNVHGESFDAIYLDHSDPLVGVISARSSQWRKPVIARFAPYESFLGMPPIAPLNRSLHLEPLRKCDRILTPSASSHRQLIALGISDRCITRQPDPYWLRVQRSQDRKKSARVSLAKVGSDFMVPDQTKLLVHFGVTQWADLKPVLAGICDLLDAGADVRTWIINSSVPNANVYDFLKDRGWHREVLLFDGFDDLEEIIQMADGAIITNPVESLQFTLPTLIAAGVRLIVKGHPDVESIPGVQDAEVLYNSPTELALNLHRWYAGNESNLQNWNKFQSMYLQHANPANAIEGWSRILQQAIGACS